MDLIIAPSILSANFADLKSDLEMIEKGEADWVHVDVMDGAFVPNITIGPPVIKSIKKYTKLPLDVHLMIEKPERYIEEFVNAGANIITIHPEACIHLDRAITIIKSLGIKAGIALNPSTPLVSIEYIIDKIDLILIMTVNPGFGGQKFIGSLIKKINQARQLINDSRRSIYLEVDGGINLTTGKSVIDAGADVLVAGNSIFSSENPINFINNLKSLSIP